MGREGEEGGPAHALAPVPPPLPSLSLKKKTHKHFISQKMCLPCLIIIRSCYFDYRISKPHTLCAKDHGLTFLS